MIVVAGGMIRSGSTFAFNIVRELLLQSDNVRTYAANGLDSSQPDFPESGHIVIKTHSPDEALLNAIRERHFPCVCTVRRAEDAIESWLRAFEFPIEHGVTMIKEWRRWYEEVSHQVLTVEYDVVEKNPKAAIRAIASYLGIEADPLTIERLAERYERGALKRQLDELKNDSATVDIGFSFYDKKTFFHRRHITSLSDGKPKSDLTPDQISWIREALDAH